MGTNFYIKRKKPRRVYDEYHIAKRSMGWKPSFEGYENTGEYDDRPSIRSVADIKELVDSGEYEIRSEYGDVLAWDDFERDVVNWNGGSPSHTPLSHYCTGLNVRHDITGAEFIYEEYY